MGSLEGKAPLVLGRISKGNLKGFHKTAVFR